MVFENLTSDLVKPASQSWVGCVLTKHPLVVDPMAFPSKNSTFHWVFLLKIIKHQPQALIGGWERWDPLHGWLGFFLGLSVLTFMFSRFQGFFHVKLVDGTLSKAKHVFGVFVWPALVWLSDLCSRCYDDEPALLGGAHLSHRSFGQRFMPKRCFWGIHHSILIQFPFLFCEV